MKFPWKISLATLALFVFTLAACRKDSIDVDVNNQYPDPSVRIETRAMGVVLDDQGNPVSNAVVSMGTDQTLTNEDGIFILKGLTPKIQPFVRVEKAGYFPSLVSFSSKAGDTGRLKAVLKPKQLAGSLNSASGGIAQLSDGSKITFEADGFTTANGNAYTGTVNVYVSYIDPSDPDHAQRVPGAFRGIGTNNEAALLHSFGMMKVLLESPGGEKLQISKPAEMVFPIPTDRIGQAPATIPLWYIDEETSLWKEEGEATLVGNTYVGMVNHFSWWNCDLNVPQVNVKGIIDVNGSKPFARVTLKFNGWQVSTTTGQSGLFEGPIPANEVFTLCVQDECGEEVYTGSFGPFSSNTDLGVISVQATAQMAEVSGSLINCDNEPLNEGYVQINGQFPIIADPATGDFSGVVYSCDGGSLTMVAFDLIDKKYSDPVEVDFNPIIDFGNVTVCDQDIEHGLTLTFNGQTVFYPIISVSVGDDSLGGVFYYYVVEDVPNGSTLYYQFYKEDLNPTDWFMASFSQGTTYNQIVQGVINPIALGLQSGDVVIFEMEDAVIREEPAGIEYPMGIARFSAVID
jgi:hypothetical protein